MSDQAAGVPAPVDLGRVVADTSAIARLGQPKLRWLVSSMSAGRVYLTPLVDLELGRVARSPAEHARQRLRRAATYRRLEHEPADYERAMDVQEQLTKGGLHRAVALTDLLVAAAAERVGYPVVHYDQDYDRIAEVTGQQVHWVAPRGSL